MFAHVLMSFHGNNTIPEVRLGIIKKYQFHRFALREHYVFVRNNLKRAIGLPHDIIRWEYK